MSTSTFPTPLSPWFVVQSLNKKGQYEYYRSPVAEDDGESYPMTKVAGLAMIFTNLPSAARVASATASEIRALVSKDDAKEFGR